MKNKIYLICLWRGIEPHIIGPFKSFEERNIKLTSLLKIGDLEDNYFTLEITPKGRVKMYSFSGKFIEDITNKAMNVLVCQGHT